MSADGYTAVMQLAEERPELLPIVKAIHEIVVEFGNTFTAGSVFSRTPRVVPNLSQLSSRGIIVKFGAAKQGHKAYYRLVDPVGVERALRQLGHL